MKQLLILIMLATTAMSQCPQDTLVYGGAPAGTYSWSTGDPIPASCALCAPYNTYNCWQFPDTMNGRVCIGGNLTPPFGDVAILATTNCSSVLFDTCGRVGHPYAFPICFSISLPPNSQVCVYWDSTTTDSVAVGAKRSTIFVPPLTTVILDMDTCDTTIPIGVQDEFPAQLSVTYYRMDTGREAHVPLSPGLHIELSGDSRRLLMVR